MATISFHLKEPNGNKPTAIFIWFNPQNGGPRIRIYTGDKIHPAYWEGGNVQQARTPKRDPETEINRAINTNNERMNKRLLTYWADCRAKDTVPTAEELRTVIEPEAAASATNRPRPLQDFEAYLEFEAEKNATNTVRSHRTTYNHLVRFVEKSRRPLEYTDFTRDWKNKFAAWLAAGSEIRPRMGDASVNKQLKILKGFLTYAADHDRTPRIDVKGWSWRFVEPEVLALTTADLTRLELLEGLPPYLENARCLWLLMAYTGLRYCDAMALKPEHDRGEVLQLVPKKTTDVAATVYIRKAARVLLQKCWAGEVHEISNPKLNAYIKLVCERAGLDELTEKITYYGQTSRPEREAIQKSQRVTCHTARRTFVSLSFEKQIPLELIMQAAGHSNARTTLRYNQTSVTRQVEVSRKAWGEEE